MQISVLLKSLAVDFEQSSVTRDFCDGNLDISIVFFVSKVIDSTLLSLRGCAKTGSSLQVEGDYFVSR